VRARGAQATPSHFLKIIPIVVSNSLQQLFNNLKGHFRVVWVLLFEFRRNDGFEQSFFGRSLQMCRCIAPNYGECFSKRRLPSRHSKGQNQTVLPWVH
jgi:hypothetical protein